MLCHHCGREGKYKNKQGKWLCENNANKCPKIREKNSIGVKKAHAKGLMREPFSREDRQKAAKTLEIKYSSLPFDKQSWERQRNTVILEQENKCLHCKNSEWMGMPLKLHVDHIDGNNRNNRRDNLRALCPNCHSNTETYCGKNINNGSKRVSDIEIIEEIKKGLTNRQILINVGLTPKGGNYERVNKLRLKAS
jgi:hypothetical protein